MFSTACQYGRYGSADPMIAICDDRRIHRVRACSGYFAGTVPVLSWRFQPQYPQAAVPL